MIITKEMLKEKVPMEQFPTRLDSAMNLYAYVKDKGLVLYNVNPTTWNCLYPFFELNHKFTLDNYQFSKKELTYQELIQEYQEQYQALYEKGLGYTKEKRKNILVSEYQKAFDLKNATISAELESFYELKYSKSKNVWTLYYFENYVVNKVDNLNSLLSQTCYPQEFLDIKHQDSVINGVDVVENTLYLLSNESNSNILKENALY